MTKKKIYLALGIVLLVGAFIQFNIIDQLVIFLLVGSLPGISWSVPPLVMFGLVAAGIIALTYFAASRQLYPGSPRMRQHRAKTLRQSARKNVTRASAKRRAATKSKQNTSTVKAS